MAKRISTVLIVLFLLAPGSFVAAEEPIAEAQGEIAYLLEYVADSDMRFERGTASYSARKAAKHLRKKYAYAADEITSADDFILRLASRSWLTGTEYRVVAPDGTRLSARQWLTSALRAHRGGAGEGRAPVSQTPPGTSAGAP